MNKSRFHQEIHLPLQSIGVQQTDEAVVQRGSSYACQPQVIRALGKKGTANLTHKSRRHDAVRKR